LRGFAIASSKERENDYYERTTTTTTVAAADMNGMRMMVSELEQLTYVNL